MSLKLHMSEERGWYKHQATPKQQSTQCACASFVRYASMSFIPACMFAWQDATQWPEQFGSQVPCNSLTRFAWPRLCRRSCASGILARSRRSVIIVLILPREPVPRVVLHALTAKRRPLGRLIYDKLRRTPLCERRAPLLRRGINALIVVLLVRLVVLAFKHV